MTQGTAGQQTAAAAGNGATVAQPAPAEKPFKLPFQDTVLEIINQGSSTAKASLFTGTYAVLAGLLLIMAPVQVFGLFFNAESVRQGWIQFGGVLLSLFGLQYLGAALTDHSTGSYSRGFYLASVWSRMYFVAVVIAMIVFHEAPKAMLILAAANLAGAVSMYMSVKKDDSLLNVADGQRGEGGMEGGDNLKTVLLENELSRVRAEREALLAEKAAAVAEHQAVMVAQQAAAGIADSEAGARQALQARLAAMEEELRKEKAHGLSLQSALRSSKDESTRLSREAQGAQATIAQLQQSLTLTDQQLATSLTKMSELRARLVEQENWVASMTSKLENQLAGSPARR